MGDESNDPIDVLRRGLKTTTRSDTEGLLGLFAVLLQLRTGLAAPAWEALADQFIRKLGWTSDRFRRLSLLSTTEDLRWAIEYQPTEAEVARFPGEELYPTTGWLGDYLRWTAGDEAPIGFHFWCALAVLATVCRRRLYVDMKRFVVFPNMYIVLVGEPATKKGQAMDMASSIFGRVNHFLSSDPTVSQWDLINVLPEKCTAEFALNLLQAKPLVWVDDDGNSQSGWTESHGVWFVEELVTLLSTSNFNPGGILELLTAFYNCPHAPQTIGTLKRKKEVLRDICLSFVGASTPGWIRGGISELLFQGGFVSRVNFIQRDATTKYYFQPEPADPIARDELAERLLPIFKIRSRTSKLTTEAFEWGEQWYHGDRDRLRFITDEHYKHYYARRQIHVLKLALLLAVSEGRTDIELSDFKQSVEILKMEERYMMPGFATMGAHEDVRLGEYVVKVLNRRGGWSSRKKLVDLTKHKLGNSSNVGRVLNNLLMEGKVGHRRSTTGAEEWYLIHTKGDPVTEALDKSWPEGVGEAEKLA